MIRRLPWSLLVLSACSLRDAQPVSPPGAAELRPEQAPRAVAVERPYLELARADLSITPSIPRLPPDFHLGQPLSIVTTALPSAEAGAPYRAELSATGGTGDCLWRFTSAPAGLTITSQPGARTGTIDGVPAAAGNFGVFVEVEDVAGHVAAATFVLFVLPGLTIVVPSMPELTVGTPFELQLSTLRGDPSPIFSLAGGTLPPGLAIDAAGHISGTPLLPGSFAASIAAIDGSGRTASLALVLDVNDNFEFITPSVVPRGLLGAPYSTTIEVAGGVPPYTFETFSLPSGLTVSSGGPAAIVLSGAPTTRGSDTFDVQVTDARGVQIVRIFQLDLDTLQIQGLSGPQTLRAGTPHSRRLTASLGTAPYGWSLLAGFDDLPAGLTLAAVNATEAEISGTPLHGGSFSVTVRVTDANGGLGDGIFEGTIEQVAITTTTLPPVTAVPYTADITAARGVEPYTFEIISGSLPSGWTFTGGSPNATISGATALPEARTLVVRVTDQLGNTGSRSYMLAEQGAANRDLALWPMPGEYRPSSEFEVYTSSVTDLLTGISWIREPFAAPTYADAAAHCTSLSAGGWNDWYVPSWIELITVTEGSGIYGLAGVFTPGNYHDYWTSTVQNGIQRSVENPAGYIDGFEVYCARSDPVADRARYSGEIGVTTNLFTGLPWADAVALDVQEVDLGEAFCGYLASGGYADWRRPTAKELASENSPGSLEYGGYFQQSDLWAMVLTQYGAVDWMTSGGVQHCVRDVQTGCGSVVADMSATPATAATGQVVTLDGGNSSAGACTPSLTWSITSPVRPATLPPSEDYVFMQSDHTGPAVPVLLTTPGIYTVTLTARVDGAVATDTRTIAAGGPSSCTLGMNVSTLWPPLSIFATGGVPPYSYGFVQLFSPHTGAWGDSSGMSSQYWQNYTYTERTQDWIVITIDSTGCVTSELVQTGG